MKVAILRDNNPDSSLKWEIACRSLGCEHITVDLLRNDWLDVIRRFDPDFCVARPPGDNQQRKNVFDAKVFVLVSQTSYEVFPGIVETLIYENKATLSYFLRVNGIPHPETFVTYSQEEALEFVKETKYPVVAKTLIGAAGSGVKMLTNRSEAKSYVELGFKHGIKRRFGPNKKTGSPKKWLVKAIQSPKYLLKKLNEYKDREQDIQKGVVLFQEYVPHDFEWRCVKIGESYFGYKKLKIGDKASGAKEFEYGEPPTELLTFTKDLCEKFGFCFMTIDYFWNNGRILVNEMQTIFGHKNPYICSVNGMKGRYRFIEQEWVFEEGEFNSNESYTLRLQVVIDYFRSDYQNLDQSEMFPKS